MGSHRGSLKSDQGEKQAILEKKDTRGSVTEAATIDPEVEMEKVKSEPGTPAAVTPSPTKAKSPQQPPSPAGSMKETPVASSRQGSSASVKKEAATASSSPPLSIPDRNTELPPAGIADDIQNQTPPPSEADKTQTEKAIERAESKASLGPSQEEQAAESPGSRVGSAGSVKRKTSSRQSSRGSLRSVRRSSRQEEASNGQEEGRETEGVDRLLLGRVIGKKLLWGFFVL